MRRYIDLCEGWRFRKNEGDEWKSVTIPHTWNNIDGQDGGNDFLRSRCCYEIDLPEVHLDAGERLYAEFEAVSFIADVYVNGKHVAHHENGFATFRCDLTDSLADENILTVYADNRRTDYTYPQFADFTFFGGIYRPARLVAVSSSHFSLDDYGSSGIRTWSEVKDGRGYLKYEAAVEGEGRTVITLYDGNNRCVAESEGAAGVICVDDPHLWNGKKDPYLYTLCARLYKGDMLEDEVSMTAAFRSFRIDPEKGFILNGEEYPLRGVCRHQDRLDKGWAVSNADHEEDISLILEMGANTVRLAHYQQAQYVYDLCDRYGLVVWAEIPYISGHLVRGVDNTLLMMRELILQNMHHPCIICWGLSNEISMFGLSEEVYENHRLLNDLCHELDHTRLSAVAELGELDSDDYLVSLPDIRSYNHYFGWYLGNVEDNVKWLDDYHAAHPGMPAGLSEYGAEASVFLHSDSPVRGDYSEEYQAEYHERMMEIISTRPFIWATHVWNMFDFAADRRNEGGCAGRNNKGLVTYDRKTKKDSFYVYKAWLSDEPFVYVNGKRFTDRSGDETSVKVYSNQKHIDLYINGRFFAHQDGSHVFSFMIPLEKKGETRVTAISGSLSDTTVLIRCEEGNPSYWLDDKASLTNWFDSADDSLSSYDSTCFSIRDDMKTLCSNAKAEREVRNYISKCADEIGISFSQLWNVVLSHDLKKAYSLMGTACIKGVEEQFFSLNERLQKIKKH